MGNLNYALIVAAGRGKRMKSDIPKQYMNINGKPIIYYTLKAYSNCHDIDAIVLVVSPDDKEYVTKEIIEKYNIKKVTAVVPGGKERYNSVLNGLKAIKDCNIVLIHDGARPFISSHIIKDGIRYAEKYGCSACGIQPKDTIKVVNSDRISEKTLDRSKLVAIQTPQCFKYDIILKCHEKLRQEEGIATDDTMVAEKYGHEVFIYDGDYRNIKITTPEDLKIGEIMVQDFLYE
ncbi:2-C-methyl-D-erythritol 4-phosphate cytidylyltransferase [Clostridium sp. 19966]|uniref:2-C-methyl-D-erythritol 4-phosphate cytidylyltransferase n=1 Tax=Clostridium sp. 19966 TaxID=2768166 RepID=UPI0028DD6F5D|nr:2-C-methyl-D-erythritol 4-phosphate cytidylyltransferase [Clostridium sp. 19966]MDT8715792.1 2-C-methyl-D-erythritol 4-phosphate cytidylyltransferase [Clostridium sp. 19966]